MIKVTVIQEDIDAGLKNNCLECPIVLASKRVPELQNVVVSNDTLRSFETGNIYELPRIAIDWIISFDMGLKVKPIEFELSLPTPYGHKKTAGTDAVTLKGNESSI